jgi:DNA-binding GntR family transcriptional regulator
VSGLAASQLGDGLASPSLVDLAVDRLRGEILGGDLAPGERLIEEQLTRRFGISRAPLREALRLLAQQGLIEHLPRRGARVATLSEQDVEELYDLRHLLERYAVQLAARVQDGSGRDGLLAAMEAMRAAQDDPLRMAHAHNRYHAAVVALAGRRQLSLAFEPVLTKLQQYMAVNMRREAQVANPRDGVRRHERLLEALLSGDPAVMLAGLAEHGDRSYLP